MSGNKLYYGGYGIHKFYTVAEDDESAVKNVQENNNMKHLPVTVEVIDNVDGFEIKPVKPKKAGEKHGDSGEPKE
jgi:hypothetical protein